MSTETLEPVLDTSVLDHLDFSIPCEIKTHSTNGMCSESDAEWIADNHHLCDLKTRLICDGFKEAMIKLGKEAGGTITCRKCNEEMPFAEYFDVIGRI